MIDGSTSKILAPNHITEFRHKERRMKMHQLHDGTWLDLDIIQIVSVQKNGNTKMPDIPYLVCIFCAQDRQYNIGFPTEEAANSYRDVLACKVNFEGPI